MTAAITVAGSLLGVVIGWWLNKLSSQDERKWVERQTVRDRQDDAAATLDTALIEAMQRAPLAQWDRKEAQEPIRDARIGVLDAWAKTTVLSDADIEARMHALDMALLAATQDVSFGNAETVNFWPLSAAVSDVRKALAAFQRHERPPAPEFFTAQEVARLTYSEGRFQAMDTLTTKLMERHAG